MTGPLDGVRVVDTTIARSGPTCSRQLADMGADVIVVGQGPRSLGGSDEMNLNRNKRAVVLDVKDPAGVAALLALVERADVFLENWRPGVKQRLCLSPGTLLARNPRLVYGSISGFGQDGPYAGRPGVDQIAQHGRPHGHYRSVGRPGAYHLLDFQAARWLIDGVDPEQEGNNHPTIPAMGSFYTADGIINIGVLTDFGGFARMVDRPDLTDDPRFATTADRVRHRDELNSVIAEVLRTRSTQAWVDLLAEAFPCGPIHRVSEVFDDPQVRHLGVTTTVDCPGGRRIEVLTHPVHFDGTPTSIRSGSPSPGQDTDDVLRELGL
jgi:crotonobetainyl-CoA:carnitine CoA-transferase CaiB-like acyl-CoA transferase